MKATTPPTNVIARLVRDVLTGHQSAHLVLDVLRIEAAGEVRAAFDEASGKRINHVGLPGFSRHGVSRAANGSDTNPLYRVAGWFLLMRRLGFSRKWAQRWVDWLQEIVDVIWPDDEPQDLHEVLDREQELDGKDDPHQLRAYGGDVDAMRQLLVIKRRQRAYDRVVISTLRHHLASVSEASAST